MIRILRALVLAGLVSMMSAGCSKRVPLRGGPALFPSGVWVRVASAYVEGDRVLLRLVFLNGAQQPLFIHPDGIEVRWPDGTLARRVMREGEPESGSARRFYGIRRGLSLELILELRADRDLGDARGATLVVGGVSFGTDPRPFVVGEVPLFATVTAPRAPGLFTPRPGPQPAP